MTSFAEAARERFRYDDRGAADAVRQEMARLPRGVLGYAQMTTPQTGITTETDLTGLTVTVLVGANRRIRVMCESVIATSAGAPGAPVLNIKEGGTVLTCATQVPTVANEMHTLSRSIVITPTAGSHTYKLSLQTPGGSVGTAPTATCPSLILVLDLGAV